MSDNALMPSRALGAWLHHSLQNKTGEVLEHFLLQFSSEHTRRNYKADLESFFSFWASFGHESVTAVDAYNEKHILVWLEQFKQSSTRARKLASLSSFFSFCEKRGWLHDNPSRLLKRPKVTNRKSAQALTEEEVEHLLQYLYDRAFVHSHVGPHAERQKNTALLRFTVIHTLLSVGMRVDELCELRVCDLEVHDTTAKLNFVTKGGDEHRVIIAQHCLNVILHYLKSLRPEHVANDFLFQRVQKGQKPQKLTQTAVFKMINESAIEAGINKSVSPHSARATVATVLHRKGTPLGFIQTLLNHKQITTTAKYVKKANERNESAALKAPVSQWLNNKS
jgi:integrase/recombinase XerD